MECTIFAKHAKNLWTGYFLAVVQTTFPKMQRANAMHILFLVSTLSPLDGGVGFTINYKSLTYFSNYIPEFKKF